MSDPTISDQVGAQLSALLDGELPQDELRFLMRRLETDAQLAERWSRYQLARNVLRRQDAAPLRVDFAAALTQRIASEALPARRRGPAVLRWVGGGAIAASVAVVALVMTRPALQAPDAATVAAAPAAIQDTRTVPSAPQVRAPIDFLASQPAAYDRPASQAPFGGLPYLRSAPVVSGSDGVPYVVVVTPLLPPPPAERKAEAPQQ